VCSVVKVLETPIVSMDWKSQQMWQIEISGWFVYHFNCCFQYRIDSLSLYITTSAWYYGMKILFRLGLLWLESILACQIPTYLLSRCHYRFISYNTDIVLNQTGGPYLFLHLLSGSFACVCCFGQETCGGMGSFLWSWRFYSKRGQFYLCLINSSFLYLRELTD